MPAGPPPAMQHWTDRVSCHHISDHRWGKCVTSDYKLKNSKYRIVWRQYEVIRLRSKERHGLEDYPLGSSVPVDCFPSSARGTRRIQTAAAKIQPESPF